MADQDANLAVVRKGFQLFNEKDIDSVVEECLHPDIEYVGDPDVSALTGFAVNLNGRDEVGAVWREFFAMFDEVQLGEIALDAGRGDSVLGDCHMVARGGSSEVPIDTPFYFAWVLRDARWRFMAAKLDRAAALGALEDWRKG